HHARRHPGAPAPAHPPTTAEAPTNPAVAAAIAPIAAVAPMAASSSSIQRVVMSRIDWICPLDHADLRVRRTAQRDHEHHTVHGANLLNYYPRGLRQKRANAPPRFHGVCDLGEDGQITCRKRAGKVYAVYDGAFRANGHCFLDTLGLLEHIRDDIPLPVVRQAARTGAIESH